MCNEFESAQRNQGEIEKADVYRRAGLAFCCVCICKGDVAPAVVVVLVVVNGGEG